MTERWVKQVEKIAIWDSKRLNAPNVYAKDAVKLLARQHRAFVRTVKNAKKTGKHPVSEVCETNEWIEGYFQACKDILAALAKQGGKK